MPSPKPPKKLNHSRAVAARYGQKSPRTIRRWVVARRFPPPDLIINGRNYWYEETLTAHERRLVAERPTAIAETSPTA